MPTEASNSPVEPSNLPEPSPQPRNRIDVAKALKLRMQGNTYEEIALLLDVTPSGVHQCLERFKTLVSNAKEPGFLNAYNDNRQSLLAAGEATLLASCLNEEAIQKAPLAARVMAFGTIFDKRRLEENKSTSNVGVLSKIISNSDDGLFK